MTILLPTLVREAHNRIYSALLEKSLGSKADIATTQLALSEISIPSEKNGKSSKTRLWKSTNITGKYSVSLFSAVLQYQRYKKIPATGSVGLNKRTIQELLKDAPGLNDKYITLLGVIRRIDLEKLKLNAKVEARRILLHAVMPNQDAAALADLVGKAAKVGIEVIAQVFKEASKDKTKIDVQTGKIRVKLAFSFGFYQSFKIENKEFIKAFKQMIKENTRWEAFGGEHKHLQLKQAYKFLKWDGIATTEYGLDFFEISKGDYQSDKRTKAIIDASYQILRKRKIVSGEAAVDPSDVKALEGTRKKDFLLLEEMMIPINESVAKNIIESPFPGHQEDIDFREIFPLYAMGFEVAGPILIVASLGLKVQILFNPNQKTEYLFIELSPAFGVSYKGSFGMEPIRKSIKDFRSFQVEAFANAEGSIDLGPLNISLKLRPEVPKLSEPEFFEGLKVGDILGLEGGLEKFIEKQKEASSDARDLENLQKNLHNKRRQFTNNVKKKLGVNELSEEKKREKKQKKRSNVANLNVLKWDFGIIELDVTLKSQFKTGRNVEFAAGVKISKLIEIDTDFMDGVLYGLLPSSVDLEKIQVSPLSGST